MKRHFDPIDILFLILISIYLISLTFILFFSLKEKKKRMNKETLISEENLEIKLKEPKKIKSQEVKKALPPKNKQKKAPNNSKKNYTPSKSTKKKTKKKNKHKKISKKKKAKR